MSGEYRPLSSGEIRAHDQACEEAIAAAQSFGEMLERFGLHDEANMAKGAARDLEQLRRVEPGKGARRG